MGLWRRLRGWLVAPLAREGKEHDLERELRAHLELEAEEFRASGLSPDEARHAARRALGNLTLIKETTREMWGFGSAERLSQDLRYAWRTLLRNPAVALVAVLCLALGIGANTAIFSVVDVVLVRPLPYPDAERLVRIETKNPPLDIRSGPASHADFLDWRASGIFEDVGTYAIGNTILRLGDGSTRVPSAAASTSLFSLLGVRPVLGRLPLPEEDGPSAHPVVLLSEGLWRRQFAADPGVVGRALSLDGKPLVVVGVLPSSFVFERNPELWTTFELSDDLTPRGNRYLEVIARLRPGEALVQAQGRLRALCDQLAAAYPKENQDWNADPVPWQESQVGHVRPQLLVLLGAVSLVLCICCGNVAILLLVRGTARQREIAVRVALGASRLRVVRQLLTEGLLLSLLGGGLGVALAASWVSLLARFGPRNVPRLLEAQVDGRALLFALSVAFLTALLFGLGPALQASRPATSASLQESGRSSAGSRRQGRLRRALLVGETALSLLLLVGAALLVKSFLKLQAVDPGLRPDRLLTFHLPLPTTKFLADGRYLGDQVSRYYEQVVQGLERLPEVEAAGAVLDLPLGGGGFRVWQGVVLGRDPAASASKRQCVAQNITPHFFQALGVPLRAGRVFTERDSPAGPPVAIVNETFARRFFPGENPLGERLRLEFEGVPVLREIVGVVGDVKPDGLDSEANPEVYKPHAQEPKPFMAIVVRTRVEAMSLASRVEGELLRIDRDVPPYRLRSAEQLLALSLAERRFSTALMAAFALLALVLAMTGLYGVISYTVAQGRREIGVRMALGATAGDVLALVLRQGLGPALSGIGLGLALSFGLTGLLSSQLYEVKPLDPAVLAAGSFLLATVSALACLLPARQALRVDPMSALRYE